MTTKISEKVFCQGINFNSPEPPSFEDIYHKRFLLDVVRIGEIELRDGFLEVLERDGDGWGGYTAEQI